MGDRLSPEWIPHTRDQNQAILDILGLVSDFWRLPSDQERLHVMEERMPPAQRSVLNASRSSDEKISGSSHVAKWPPLSTSLK